ncbi:hypothetical protein B0F90DRAFT_1005890 [Multifurca ochricompacta]|uniref:Protein kinase domain-containing protein n=1 Tax=Multifurca ochricompacta TaxID=376703 RepID=A0AAD4LZN0_9AGAM|nr:hypothetical protein B0F90DRAFT_1005890 [Multifurca ochricompacta]
MDSRLPPISLVYHGFGRFRDHINDHSDGPMPAHLPDFEKAVTKFMSAMCAYYYDHEDRGITARECLNEIWKSYLGEQEFDEIKHGIIGPDGSSDGFTIGSANTMEVIVVVKNELGTTDCDGSVELAAYYTQSLESNTSQKSRKRFLFPALGILVVGAHVGFYALSFTKSTRLVALTPLLPAVIERGNEWATPALMRALEASCILRYHISKDTAEFMADRLPHPPQGDLPYINEVPTHPPSETLRFEIKVEAYQGKDFRYENRFIYGAKDKNKDWVVVKFTQKYCLPLHLFCAEKKHAPRVLGYGFVHGGWHVIVMEWIANVDREYYASKYLPRWSKDLKELVDGFHEEGFVHGDLRDANLIVPKKNPEQIMLLDFDWGGEAKSGAVYYPTARLNADLMLGENPKHLEITVTRDNLALDNTLRKMNTEIEMDED